MREYSCTFYLELLHTTPTTNPYFNPLFLNLYIIQKHLTAQSSTFEVHSLLRQIISVLRTDIRLIPESEVVLITTRGSTH